MSKHPLTTTREAARQHTEHSRALCTLQNERGTIAVPVAVKLLLPAAVAGAAAAVTTAERMSPLALEPSLLVSWTLLTLAAISAAVIGKIGLGMLRAYYILRIRAGERGMHVHCWCWVCHIIVGRLLDKPACTTAVGSLRLGLEQAVTLSSKYERRVLILWIV